MKNLYSTMAETQRYSFYKKTRKGKVVSLVHEKYLRTDVEFGYLLGKTLSADKYRNIVRDAPHQQLLVIDTNVALHQIDLLEHSCPATSLVVILQTVLQELRNLNMAGYRRINALLNDEKRSYIFYPNELSSDTHILREFNESSNDFNDRQIRKAVDYFSNGLHGTGKVYMISNDLNNRKCALNEGILALSLRAYVERFLHQYPELQDLLAADSEEHRVVGGDSTTHQLFPSHVSMAEILAGLKSKRYMKGTLRCRRDDWTDCYVVVHTAESEPRISVTVSGPLNVNRALDGDVVALEVIEDSQSEQTCNVAALRTVHVADDAVTAGIADATAEPTAEALEGITVSDFYTTATSSATSSSTASKKGNIQAKVVGVIRRNWRQFAGSLDNTSDEIPATGIPMPSGIDSDGAAAAVHGPVCSLLFRAVDKKIPHVRITTRRRDDLVGCRILTAIDHWPANSQYPIGHYVRTLGREGDKSVETQVLLHEFDVPHEAFSATVMACLPPEGWKITDDIITQRTDLRHIPVVSIDPPGCKDIDDALHCMRLSNGNLQVGVHIADVTYFVEPDSPLDKEASHRSTSTYLVERRLDMLPGLLTTQLCSLRSKEDHLAFSVLWEMDDNADIVDVSFCKSVIHSVASLTYDEAQAMLDDQGEKDAVAESVNLLNKLARLLRARRIEMGALTLASPEVRFKLDAESQDPTDVGMYTLKEANALVEEWMLLANITVSKKILRHFPTLALLRRHQPPSREQFAPLLAAAAAVGMRIDISSSKSLADTLDLAMKESDPYFNKLIRIMSTRCMMPAQYFCSGEIPKEQWHHYGLAAPVYTHFTSPIRRYADVVVHRLLAAAIGVIPLPAANADRSRQQELAAHMNRRHKAAQYAQRASVNLHTLLFFKSRPSTETAYVLSVSAGRFIVLVPRFGIEGSISFDRITQILNGEVKYEPDSHRATICATKAGVSLFSVQVFQQVTVTIKVKKEQAGSRRLVINVIVGGREMSDYEDDSNEKMNDEMSDYEDDSNERVNDGEQEDENNFDTNEERENKMVLISANVSESDLNEHMEMVEEQFDEADGSGDEEKDRSDDILRDVPVRLSIKTKSRKRVTTSSILSTKPQQPGRRKRRKLRQPGKEL